MITDALSAKFLMSFLNRNNQQFNFRNYYIDNCYTKIMIQKSMNSVKSKHQTLHQAVFRGLVVKLLNIMN